MLTDEQIKEFQTLWEKRFGVKIDRKEAYDKGAKLMRMVQLVYKPMTEEEYQKLQERRKETKELLNLENNLKK
jgi:hypothetical protein